MLLFLSRLLFFYNAPKRGVADDDDDDDDDDVALRLSLLFFTLNNSTGIETRIERHSGEKRRFERK